MSWNLANIAYDNKSFSVTNEDYSPEAIAFNSDGTKMYMLGWATDTVYQYTLSTPWDVSTAIYDDVSFLVRSQESLPVAMYFKPDGTKMYISGQHNNIYQYTLSTPWDLSTVSYDNKSFDTGGQTWNPYGIHFKPDGSKMYIVGNVYDADAEVYQYSLSTPWDVETASYDNKSFLIGLRWRYDIQFKPDGTRMYIIDGTSDKILQYSLSVAWDVTSASYDNVSDQQHYPHSMDFKTDGTKIYMLSKITDIVYQYSLIPVINCTGKSSITTLVTVEISYVIIETVKAYKSGVFTRMELTGDIKKADNIFKRGFEYIVQDGEPDEEAEGTEIIEESEEEFETGEYTLNDYDEELPLMYRNPLYQLDEDTIFWFRAIAYIGEEKETSDWMKNVPTMITSECTETNAFSTKGNGELTDIGANIVTERGFYLIKEFSGSIFDIHKYTFHGFSVLYLTPITLYNPDGTLMGFAYEGELVKIVSTKNIYGYDPEGYELGIGTGILDSIYPGDSYKVKAFGKNQLGRGFGEEVIVNTEQVMSEPDEAIKSPTTVIITVKLDNLPEGYKAVRIGKKYGRTTSCNEGIVYEDGEWNNEEEITLFITDLIPGEKYYEIPFMIIEDDSGAQDIIEPPEGPGDNWDDEFPPFTLPEWEDFPDIEIPLSDLVGIDYETIIKEIKCSIVADQSIIDKYGRKRTLTIKNPLIQTKEFCKSIRDNYLNRFQELKLKIEIDYDIPLPFEREDTILLAYGRINYKTDGNGVIEAKADGEGIISGKMSILTKVRKINVNAKPEEAILTLELEV